MWVRSKNAKKKEIINSPFEKKKKTLYISYVISGQNVASLRWPTANCMSATAPNRFSLLSVISFKISTWKFTIRLIPWNLHVRFWNETFNVCVRKIGLLARKAYYYLLLCNFMFPFVNLRHKFWALCNTILREIKKHI